MELHNAIVEVLKKNGGKMTAKGIAEKVNSHNLYSRADGKPLHGGQISARINKYSHLFSVDKSVKPMLIGLP
jgi:hypothetical protein